MKKINVIRVLVAGSLFSVIWSFVINAIGIQKDSLQQKNIDNYAMQLMIIQPRTLLTSSPFYGLDADMVATTSTLNAQVITRSTSTAGFGIVTIVTP